MNASPVRWRRRIALLFSRRADRRTSRWIWVVSLAATLAAALVLTFLLAIATNNRQLYERHYTWLFWVNVVIAALLVAVIVGAGLRLIARVLRGRFGSRLLLRLALIFGLVGVLPGVLVYTVSYQFVSRSIESWFDVRVEGALEAGLNLGRGTLDTLVNDVAAKTVLAAERLGEAPERQSPLQLERLREQLSAQDVAVLGTNGQVLASAGAATRLTPERPGSSLLRQARAARVTSQLEGLDDDSAAGRIAVPGPATPSTQPRVRVVALIPSTSFSLGSEDRFLMVTQLLPSSLAANALAVQSAYREYQQRSLAREGLRKMYIGTLTLTLILAVFGAVLLAVTFGNWLARPLLLLADGVREVARGNLGPKAVFASRDELGGLTRSFASMTQQLADARRLVEQGLAELETARTKLQTILDNMSAGVIVFDREGRIDSVNPGATRILRLPLSAYVGRPPAEAAGLAEFDAAIGQRFDQLVAGPEPGERDQWQDSFDLRTGNERESITLLVRGAQLPGGARLIVFDDITELVSAQRAEAWGEVARRLAHEIKNPLTPIQLSAERLQHKLEARLEGADQQMLVRSVATIVAQVQAMKQLVNEFRDYARLPAAQLAPLDLNALVAEVLVLYAQQQEAGRLEPAFGDDLPLIEGDATQLRQVVHNLVQNALDAVAERASGRVRVRTEAPRDEQGQVRAVRLVVTDNGPGFGEHVLRRAFEPYVTTKSKGTGLGLAVVKKIADEHGARVKLSNLPAPPTEAGEPAVGGAQVSLSFSKWLARDASAGAGSRAPSAAH